MDPDPHPEKHPNNYVEDGSYEMLPTDDHRQTNTNYLGIAPVEWMVL